MSVSVQRGAASWWPQHLVLAWLNLALSAPLIYLYLGLPLLLRQQGWSGTSIGLLQLAGLPAMLKFVLALPIERLRLGQASYRNWAALLGLAYAAALALLALHDLAHSPRWLLFGLAMAVNLLGTWADVPTNALAIEILPESEHVRAGAIRSAATSLGAIVGGGLALLIHGRFGWAGSFMALTAPVVLGAALIFALPAKRAGRAPIPVAVKAGWREWIGYFGLPQRRRWCLLMLCYFPFVGAAWVYLKPLLLDQGFDPQRIAMLVGLAGGLVGAVSSLAGAYLTRVLGLGRTLPGFAVFNVIALSVLLAATVLATSAPVFMLAALMVAMAMGASAGLVFGAMMFHIRPGLAALDYGLQSSLFVLARALVPFAAGVLLDRFGYAGMLIGLLAGAGFALLLALGMGTSSKPSGAYS